MRSLLRNISAHPIVSGLILGALVEICTLIGRFAFGLRVADHREAVVRLTFGLRVHHCYPGLVLVAVWLVARALQARGWWPGVLGALGIALLASDVVHHLILLLVTGSGEFP
jgi:hypothetical protein